MAATTAPVIVALQNHFSKKTGNVFITHQAIIDALLTIYQIHQKPTHFDPDRLDDNSDLCSNDSTNSLVDGAPAGDTVVAKSPTHHRKEDAGSSDEERIKEILALLIALKHENANLHERLKALEEERLYGNPRNNLEDVLIDFQERFVKIQTYKNIEYLIAFKMALPATLAGFMLFIIPASLGDLDFKTQFVQTDVGIAIFVAIGVWSAAVFIATTLRRQWNDSVDLLFQKYKASVTTFLDKTIPGHRLDLDPLFTLMGRNVEQIKNNQIPTTSADELNWVGVRLNALRNPNDPDQISDEMVAHMERRSKANAWTLFIITGAVISGMFLAGFFHEKKSLIPEMPKLTDEQKEMFDEMRRRWEQWQAEHPDQPMEPPTFDFETTATEPSVSQVMQSDMMIAMISLVAIFVAIVAIYTYHHLQEQKEERVKPTTGMRM